MKETNKYAIGWKKKHKEFHNYASGTTIGDEEYNKLIVEKETLDLYEVICPNKEVKWVEYYY